MLLLPLKENSEPPLNQAGPECLWFIQVKMSLWINEIASSSAVTTEHEHSTPPTPDWAHKEGKQHLWCTSTTAVFGASVINECWFGHKMFPLIRQQCSHSFSRLWYLQLPTCQHGRRSDGQISQAAAARCSGNEPRASQDARNKENPQAKAGFHGLRGV